MIEKQDENGEIPSLVKEKIQEIKNDSVHGSTILLNDAINVFQNFISSEQPISIHLLQTIALQLIQAQPTMASLVTFSNKLLNFMEDFPHMNKNQETFKNSLNSFLKQFRESLEKSEKAIQKNAVNHLESYSLIATYSLSGTIQKVIESLAKHRNNLTVYCSESRPNNEGTLLAKTLANQGIKTILMTDATLFSSISEVNAVIIGADAITKNGVVNKMGSYPLSQLSNQNNVSVYCVCSFNKMLPADYSLPREPEKPSSDILSEKYLNLDVINYYFDTTPLELFTGIITEKGLLTYEKIREYLEDTTLHPCLKD